MDKVLVLGGTGTIGEHLVGALVSKGFKVTVTSRKCHDSSENIKYLKGNARDLSFISSVLKDRWSAVVDLMVYNTEEFKQRVKLFLDSTDQYVFVSSSRVYADAHKTIIKESSKRLIDVIKDNDFLNSDEYSLAKARQENILFESNSKNWTIVRPYITYGAQRLQLGHLEKEGWLYRVLNSRSVVIPTQVFGSYTTLTSGEDVGKSISCLIGAKGVRSNVFNVVNGVELTWQEVSEIYRTAIYKKTKYELRVITCDVGTLSKYVPNKFQLLYDRSFNRRFSNEKLAKYVDLSHFTPPAVGLEKYISNFLDSPQFLPINWQLEAISDRFSGEYTPMSAIKEYKRRLKYLGYRYAPKVFL